MVFVLFTSISSYHLDAPLWWEGCLVFYEFEGEVSYPFWDSFEEIDVSKNWVDIFEDGPVVDVA
jgi:hypothetical protein